MAQETRKLRVLSLDSGGIRGLSSLLILQSIMGNIQKSDTPQGKLVEEVEEPSPCDHFDYIAGTGIGGVIALLLGRLKLPISRCILAYRDLSSLILRGEGCYPLYDMDKLLEVAKQIVKSSALMDNKPNGRETAETIIFAREKLGRMRCIYSVDKRLNDMDPFTPIPNLIGALLAARGLLREHTIQDKFDNKVTFLDRPYHPYPLSRPEENELIFSAVEERELHKNHRFDPRHASVVSIGTGEIAKGDIADLVLLDRAHEDIGFFNSIFKNSIALSIDRDILWRRIDPEFEALRISNDIHYSRFYHRYRRYYRFQIPPVSDVGPNDFRSVKEVADETDRYLDSKKQTLETLVKDIESEDIESTIWPIWANVHTI